MFYHKAAEFVIMNLNCSFISPLVVLLKGGSENCIKHWFLPQYHLAIVNPYAASGKFGQYKMMQ